MDYELIDKIVDKQIRHYEFLHDDERYGAIKEMHNYTFFIRSVLWEYLEIQKRSRLQDADKAP